MATRIVIDPCKIAKSQIANLNSELKSVNTTIGQLQKLLSNASPGTRPYDSIALQIALQKIKLALLKAEVDSWTKFGKTFGCF